VCDGISTTETDLSSETLFFFLVFRWHRAFLLELLEQDVLNVQIVLSICEELSIGDEYNEAKDDPVDDPARLGRELTDG